MEKRLRKKEKKKNSCHQRCSCSPRALETVLTHDTHIIALVVSVSGLAELRDHARPFQDMDKGS